ncbi:MAG: hypothetical protein HYT79_06985 [Elusimicrobia bacterium]|nr:hypothetical protein [Elusimicrobiota bacterium]
MLNSHWRLPFLLILAVALPAPIILANEERQSQYPEDDGDDGDGRQSQYPEEPEGFDCAADPSCRAAAESRGEDPGSVSQQFLEDYLAGRIPGHSPPPDRSSPGTAPGPSADPSAAGPSTERGKALDEGRKAMAEKAASGDVRGGHSGLSGTFSGTGRPPGFEEELGAAAHLEHTLGVAAAPKIPGAPKIERPELYTGETAPAAAPAGTVAAPPEAKPALADLYKAPTAEGLKAALPLSPSADFTRERDSLTDKLAGRAVSAVEKLGNVELAGKLHALMAMTDSHERAVLLRETLGEADALIETTYRAKICETFKGLPKKEKACLSGELSKDDLTKAQSIAAKENPELALYINQKRAYQTFLEGGMKDGRLALGDRLEPWEIGLNPASGADIRIEKDATAIAGVEFLGFKIKTKDGTEIFEGTRAGTDGLEKIKIIRSPSGEVKTAVLILRTTKDKKGKETEEIVRSSVEIKDKDGRLVETEKYDKSKGLVEKEWFKEGKKIKSLEERTAKGVKTVTHKEFNPKSTAKDPPPKLVVVAEFKLEKGKEKEIKRTIYKDDTETVIMPDGSATVTNKKFDPKRPWKYMKGKISGEGFLQTEIAFGEAGVDCAVTGSTSKCTILRGKTVIADGKAEFRPDVIISPAGTCRGVIDEKGACNSPEEYRPKEGPGFRMHGPHVAEYFEVSPGADGKEIRTGLMASLISVNTPGESLSMANSVGKLMGFDEGRIKAMSNWIYDGANLWRIHNPASSLARIKLKPEESPFRLWIDLKSGEDIKDKSMILYFDNAMGKDRRVESARFLLATKRFESEAPGAALVVYAPLHLDINDKPVGPKLDEAGLLRWREYPADHWNWNYVRCWETETKGDPSLMEKYADAGSMTLSHAKFLVEREAGKGCRGKEISRTPIGKPVTEKIKVEKSMEEFVKLRKLEMMKRRMKSPMEEGLEWAMDKSAALGRGTIEGFKAGGLAWAAIASEMTGDKETSAAYGLGVYASLLRTGAVYTPDEILAKVKADKKVLVFLDAEVRAGRSDAYKALRGPGATPESLIAAKKMDSAPVTDAERLAHLRKYGTAEHILERAEETGSAALYAAGGADAFITTFAEGWPMMMGFTGLEAIERVKRLGSLAKAATLTKAAAGAYMTSGLIIGGVSYVGEFADAAGRGDAADMVKAAATAAADFGLADVVIHKVFGVHSSEKATMEALRKERLALEKDSTPTAELIFIEIHDLVAGKRDFEGIMKAYGYEGPVSLDNGKGILTVRPGDVGTKDLKAMLIAKGIRVYDSWPKEWSPIFDSKSTDSKTEPIDTGTTKIEDKAPPGPGDVAISASETDISLTIKFEKYGDALRMKYIIGDSSVHDRTLRVRKDTPADIVSDLKRVGYAIEIIEALSPSGPTAKKTPKPSSVADPDKTSPAVPKAMAEKTLDSDKTLVDAPSADAAFKGFLPPEIAARRIEAFAEARKHIFGSAGSSDAFLRVRPDIPWDKYETLKKAGFDVIVEGEITERSSGDTSVGPAPGPPAAKKRVMLERVKRPDGSWEYVDASGKKFILDDPRHEIEAGTPIAGGMSRGRGSSREKLLVDWSKDKALNDLYTEILKPYEERGLDGAEKTALLGKVYEKVRKTIPASLTAEAEIKSKFKNKTVLIGEACVGFGGVCRHQGIVIAAIVERLTKEGYLNGVASYVRGPGHGFAAYRSSDGTWIILDGVQNYFGLAKDAYFIGEDSSGRGLFPYADYLPKETKPSEPAAKTKPAPRRDAMIMEPVFYLDPLTSPKADKTIKTIETKFKDDVMIHTDKETGLVRIYAESEVVKKIHELLKGDGIEILSEEAYGRKKVLRSP